jgi:hypothetical protein
LVLTAGAGGCTRHHFRLRADREVATVLADKDQYPLWRIEQYHVYPDPRARFADPTNPDRPPMPPDDPAAMALSPNPQKPGKAGVAYVVGTGYLDLLATWDEENRAKAAAEAAAKPDAAPPPAEGTMPKTEARGQDADAEVQPASAPAEEPPTLAQACGLTGTQRAQPYLINLEQSSELGLINSREFQDRREDLYLAALPVTLERFAFAAQFIALENAVREVTGRQRPEGQHNRWRLNSTVGFSKLFSTGALLLFRIANQTVIELTGRQPRHTISTSTLSLDLVQPLLRGGGKAVTLEPLTQVERNLLYEIRSYARFRKEYYVAVAATGFPGTTGYLPVLLQGAQLVNQRKNVRALEENLRLFNAFKEGGEYSQLQVDQVELNLLNARSAVLQGEQNYRAGQDRFKLQLGLPTTLPLELDDGPLRPLVRQLQRFEEVFEQFTTVRKRVEAYDKLADPAQLREQLRRVFAESPLVQGTRFQKQLPRRWGVWEKLSPDELRAKLTALRDERIKLLALQTDLQLQNQELPEEQQRRLGEIDFEYDLGTLELLLRLYEEQPWKREIAEERRERVRQTLFRDLLNAFILVGGEARNERVDAIRQGWPELPSACVNNVDLIKADLEEAQAIVAQTALVNRFDLMNTRAQLVDAWRQIAVTANSLLAVLDVEYHLESLTPPGQAKPLAFTGSRSRHQLTFNAEAPLIRKLERNTYRASLIGYQRQRRLLMAAEDSVVATVRDEIRRLRVSAENYTIAKRAVELAYFQVENSLEQLLQPPTPSGQIGGPPPAGGGGAGNAAALTQQLLNAQQAIVNAQNRLYGFWIDYQITRLQLYRDLELMPLDYRGVWIDDLATCLPPGAGCAGQSGQPARAPTTERTDSGDQGERLPEPQPLPPAPGPGAPEGD